jgi:hypothetical protein
MNLANHLQQRLITILVRPFSRDNAVEYKSGLRKASRILLLLPPAGLSSPEKTLGSLRNIFPHAQLTLLNAGNEIPAAKKQPDVPQTYLDLRKQTYWALSRSPALDALVRRRFDVFLDLDPAYSLLAVYLCQSMRAPIRIGFAKPQSEKFYNFQFHGKSGATEAQQTAGLLQFLKSFIGN